MAKWHIILLAFIPPVTTYLFAVICAVRISFDGKTALTTWPLGTGPELTALRSGHVKALVSRTLFHTSDAPKDDQSLFESSTCPVVNLSVSRWSS